MDSKSSTLHCPNGAMDLLSRNNGSDVLIYSRFAPPVNIFVEKVGYPFWCLLGFPGSILSIHIWSRKKMRRTGGVAAAVYQTALGVVDFSFFLVQVMWYLHTAWHLRTLDWPVICEGFAIANYLVQYSSPVLTLVFTVERYIAICFPFKVSARRFQNTFRSSIHVVISSIIFCAMLSGMQGLFYTTTNGNCGLRPNFEVEGENGWLLYTVWTMCTELLIFGVLPLICLLLNIFVIRTLRNIVAAQRAYRHKMPRNRTQPSDYKNVRTVDLLSRNQSGAVSGNSSSWSSSTMTLLCVSFYLIFAHFSVAIMVLLYIILPMGDTCMTDEEILNDPVWRRHFQFFAIRSLIDSFGISHFAAKFYIYLATSATFREQFLLIFRSCSSNYSNARSKPRFGSIFGNTNVSFLQELSAKTSTPNILLVCKNSVSSAQPSRNSNSGIKRSSLSRCKKKLKMSRRVPGKQRTVINITGERVCIKGV